jgi:hypothetical protein
MSDHGFRTNPEIVDLGKGPLIGGRPIGAANVGII